MALTPDSCAMLTDLPHVARARVAFFASMLRKLAVDAPAADGFEALLRPAGGTEDLPIGADPRLGIGERVSVRLPTAEIVDGVVEGFGLGVYAVRREDGDRVSAIRRRVWRANADVPVETLEPGMKCDVATDGALRPGRVISRYESKAGVQVDVQFDDSGEVLRGVARGDVHALQVPVEFPNSPAFVNKTVNIAGVEFEIRVPAAKVGFGE